ncbi:protein LIGHT-DEPENDENT SHORT HYPOCOTYLS 10-like [Dorcoceras hygrometricum]|uniref:Protein LIGHT-DEPENDENT SHORT HYPOCOTYLS 10-like n=1 Tax=Dorcoceras hygrometricum TaxID=472368 RepID=A0A2Z7CE92_9LAMI|nr:protein LIGHT-DEPENDENT SHORT HYPOCOTYLS 10-like [Dorcoceras hygrometricum]
MSTWVNFPVARRGCVVVSLLRLGVQLRVSFDAIACCWLLPESSGFLAGLVVAQFRDVRASGNTALSSPCWDRSHHDSSGNPGFTVGRGYNPAGGAPGGG